MGLENLRSQTLRNNARVPTQSLVGALMRSMRRGEKQRVNSVPRTPEIIGRQVGNVITALAEQPDRPLESPEQPQAQPENPNTTPL